MNPAKYLLVVYNKPYVRASKKYASNRIVSGNHATYTESHRHVNQHVSVINLCGAMEALAVIWRP